MGNDLTPKQAAFVAEYLVDLNATQAANRAGYSEKTADQQGSRLLANVKVASAITVAKERRSERTEITQDLVLKSILDTMQRCRQVEPVRSADGSPVMVEVGDGTTAPAYKFDAANALRAAELLGKHLVMFTDKVDHTSSDGSMSPGQMTEAQIDEEIARLAAKLGGDSATVH